LESVTWRANPDWGHKLGYSSAELIDINRKAIELLQDIRQEWETEQSKIAISGY
jgi:S-methylmethionine-dependent homocysteine/selenocysteine methylase